MGVKTEPCCANLNSDLAGTVTLQRVFRRHDISVDSFTVEVGDEDNVRTLIGVAELSRLLADEPGEPQRAGTASLR